MIDDENRSKENHDMFSLGFMLVIIASILVVFSVMMIMLKI